ncbi:hypothetical protein [Sphingopyxis sp.]|uniref:hypothetical protein n=1 Tax=Sphingopyxis sp. TaxID=1908224 RepID=UPI003BA89101
MSLFLSLALAAAGSDAGQPAKPAKPKKVCERVEMSGSNIPKRVCRTVVEPTQPKDEASAEPNKPSTGATN